jgi:hypothetical protein
MLYSIDQGVGEAAPVDSVQATVRWRYAAKNSTQTVSVTVKGVAGQPLQGVRVDIAFPNATGGTRLLRRYTTANGIATAEAAIGASPFGARRDVGVTVKTGEVVKTASTWFTTSRKLAASTAGYKTAVNDRTVYPGESVRIGSLARDTSGRGVPNLKVNWTLTYENGKVVTGSGYTNVQGRAFMSLPITDATPKGLVRVVARTQSASVNRTSTSSFRVY